MNTPANSPRRSVLALATALALARLIATGAPAAPADSPRSVLSLDKDWRFHRGTLFPGRFGGPITAWRWKADDRGERAAAEMAAPDLDTDGEGWQDARPGDDVFHGRRGFAWFRTVLPAAPARQPVVHFYSVDDNAVVYLNGTRLARHEGWNEPFDVPLGAAWRNSGRNVLAVLVQNTDGRGGIGRATFQEVKPDERPGPDSPIHPRFDDSSWRQVDVPHDFIVEGTFDPDADGDHGFLPVDEGWYRKSFAIPAAAAGRRLWLEFDGVYRNSRAWLNGKYLGKHPSGYRSFRYDVTAAAQPGETNVLTVHVDPTAFEGWWYEGGGIYRHVRLVAVDPVHIAPWGVFVRSTVPDPGDGVRADATVTVSTTLANESGSAAEATLVSEVLDAGGAVVATARRTARLGANATDETVTQELRLGKASLWSLEQPYLYRLRTTLMVDDKTVDQVSTPFGVRSARFDPDRGFFLNGRPVKLQGTSNHQDHAGVGIAVPDRLHVWRIERLKEMGCNAYRCSHNPVAPELLDACDRLGMLVMDETRHLGDTYAVKSSVTTPFAQLGDLTAMVLRDRNHPSIILWSICNEEFIQGRPAGGTIARAMKDRINQLDGTRPVTAAMNGGHGSPGGISSVVDVEGFNYYPNEYAPYHRRHPRQPIVATETASAVATRGVYSMTRFGRYYGEPRRGYVAAYDINAPDYAATAEDGWLSVARDPSVAGAFVWTGFDYKGEPTPFSWPCINSHFGILDICGFPKDTYWYYRAWWTHKPVLHIFPHWNWPGREGREIDVWCYSNCQKVELFLNGTSLGAQEMDPLRHLVWKVKYRPGVLLARGTRDGKEYTARVETTGAPTAVVLEPDRTALTAGGDVAVVTVRVVDARGRTVPVADNEVSFAVEGPGRLIGVGNGDPSSHEPDKAPRRRVFQGLCQALVQTGDTRGPIKLTARSAGLKPAAVTLRAD
jgi:beta-galactosidase